VYIVTPSGHKVPFYGILFEALKLLDDYLLFMQKRAFSSKLLYISVAKGKNVSDLG
jgi:hypothetical protein